MHQLLSVSVTERGRIFFAELASALFQENFKVISASLSDLKSKIELDSYLKKFELVLWENHEDIFSYLSISKKMSLVFGDFRHGTQRSASSVAAWLDIEVIPSTYVSLIQTIVALKQESAVHDQMGDLSKKLRSVMEQSLLDLQKIKQLHEQLVPVRETKVKGLHIVGKYLCGNDAGGEFFDMVKDEKSVTIVLTSCDSYSMSGAILNLFSEFKEIGNTSLLKRKEFVRALYEALAQVNQDESNKAKLNVLVLTIDLNTLNCELIHLGGSEVLSTHDNYIAPNSFSDTVAMLDEAISRFRLSRGERILLLSPGLKKNCGEWIGGEPITSFFKKHSGDKSRDLLHEIFYLIKKGTNGEYPEFDSSVILLEVDSHAILQV